MLHKIRQKTTVFYSIAKSRFSLKTLLRRSLGNSVYRVATQTPRVINFIIRPHYEPEIHVLKQLVPTGSTCFDIGANYGHYSRILSPIIGGEGHIYAFEPSSITCRGLRAVKSILRWGNVDIMQCALADKPGKLTLTIPIKSHGGLGIALAHLSTAIDSQGITETVAVKTLDGFVSERSISSCDFIKCDVEGAELLVLRGGIDTLTRFKPTIILETEANFLRRNQHSTSDVETFLRQQGYNFYVWRNNALQTVDGLQNKHNTVLIHPSRKQALQRLAA